MGFRVLLAAVTGKTPATIHQDFGLVATGEFEEIAESPVVGKTLANGSYLLYINDEDLIIPDDKLFSTLSKGAQLLACYVNETCMDSTAAWWEDGRQQWSVSHSAELGIMHLETSGRLPSAFAAIRDTLLEKQKGDNDADYVFDIPVELVKELGGFRYDYDIEGADGQKFQVLEPVEES